MFDFLLEQSLKTKVKSELKNDKSDDILMKYKLLNVLQGDMKEIDYS